MYKVSILQFLDALENTTSPLAYVGLCRTRGIFINYYFLYFWLVVSVLEKISSAYCIYLFLSDLQS